MRVIYSIFLCCFCISLFSQTSTYNNALKIKLDDKFFLNQQHTLLVKGNSTQLQTYQQTYNYRLNYFVGNIASITCNLSSVSALIEYKIINYAEFVEHNYKTMNDTMLVKNKIKPVKIGGFPFTQAYDGNGVLIGIIDTGIDFNHPDFKDSFGNTRIKFLWDQVPTSGSTVPAPYNYGIEWTAAQINASVCTHNDLPNYGHGTHVSGIAAGNGLANGTHEGCAPKADLVVVALDFNKSGPTIADAVSYIFSKAFVLGKPCVINASVGDYYGSHDGTDLEAKLIESMVKNVSGHVMVAAAGNAGAYKFHVKTQPPVGDTSFTWIQNGSNLKYWCYADTNQIKNVQISIGANRTNYFNLGNIGFKSYNYGLSSLKTDTLKYNNNRIGIVKTSASINTYGVYELYVQITADTTNLLWRIESKGNGLHHAWNFDFVDSPLPTVGQYSKITKYIMPDTMYSIVSSFQCLDDVITVANYVNLNTYYDVNNTLQTTTEIAGGISATSSSGPTRDNKVKPDISATGSNVFSCIALGMQASLISGAPQVVAQGSFHVQGGGTSAASPVVCGLAALYLQKYPNATSIQVRNAIINCAYSDAFTTSTLPNYRWGYGKLNGKGAMLCSIPTAINNVKINEVVNYFPNPFTDKVKLSFENEETKSIFVYSVDGKLVFTDTFSNFNYELNSNKFMVNAKGLLFVKVQSDNYTSIFKLIRIQ